VEVHTVPRATYGKKWGRVHTITVKKKSKDSKPAEDVVRDLKKEQQKLRGEDYRERSLALHGLICARCGRDFDESKRHLLTVHHKDGNHNNNPLDGSNWENLCVYCHEDVHSRGILGDYLEGASAGSDSSLVYEDVNLKDSHSGSLGEKLKKALEKKVNR
jgi:5-methylcytosine-specific restriction endonuclease McrA